MLNDLGAKLVSKTGIQLIPLLLLMVSLAAVASIILWHTTQQHELVTQQFRNNGRHQAQTIEKVWTQWVAERQQRLAAAVQSKQLIIALQQQDKGALKTAETNLHLSFPEAKAICVIPGLVSEPGDNYCVAITFATLSNLRQAYEHKQTLAAMMQAGTKQAHVLFVKEVTDPEGKVLGAAALAIKPETVSNLLSKLYQGHGYLELQQGAQNTLVLAHSGNPAAKQGGISISLPIPGSYWHLRYWPATSVATFSAFNTTISVLLVMVALWLLTSLWQRMVLKQDATVLRHQIDDFAKNKLKPEYHLHSHLLDALALDIHNLVLPTSPAKKVRKPESHNEHVTTASPLPPAEPSVASVEVSTRIFKAYDIRGIVGEELSKDVMRILGQAIASEALDQGQSAMVVGRDGRLSSSSYSNALIEGISAAGCDVSDMGEVPTPLVYFACEQLGIASCVMVTGSHNPPDYNGLKVVIAGKTLAGEQVMNLYQRIEQGQLRVGQGKIQQAQILSDYIAKVTENIKLTRSIKVVIDCGNGVTGHLIPALFTALGCEVVPLFNEVDGNFPNHHPDPGQPDNLQSLIQAVDQHQAELGLAFDGDGDRLGVVDGHGQILWPDRLLVLLAQDVLSSHPGASVIYDVKSSSLLADAIVRAGGKAVMSASGHSIIKQKMKETEAVLAGELSGHIFFKDRWYGFDDALYAAGRLLEFIAADPLERSATEIFAAIPKRADTPELLIEMEENDARSFIQRLTEQGDFNGGEVTTIDGIRVDYPNGWGLVRVSNTVPAVTMRFEAGDEATLNRIKQIFAQQMLQIKPTLVLPF